MSEEMNPVSPRLVTSRYIHHLSWMFLLAAAAAAAGFWWTPWFYWAAGIFVALFFWLLWLIPAQVRNMGWLETDNELVLSKGKMFHTITVIPYGRIQFVDVESGPISRSLGLKELKVHTASSSSDSDLPGLLAEDADALRDRLAVKARERMSGL